MAGKNQPLDGWKSEDFNSDVQTSLTAVDKRLTPFVFYRSNLANSASDVNAFFGIADFVYLNMPYDGEIVAFQVQLSSGSNGDDMSARVLKNISEITSTELALANGSQSNKVILGTPVSFVANNAINVTFDTGASWTGITTDMVCVVYVRFT